MRFLFAAALLLLVLPGTASAQVCESLLHDGQAVYAGYAYDSHDRGYAYGPRGTIHFENGLGVSGRYNVIVLDGVEVKAQEFGATVHFQRRVGNRAAWCGGAGVHRGWLHGYEQTDWGPLMWGGDPPQPTRIEQRAYALPMSVGGGLDLVRETERRLILFAEITRTERYLRVERFTVQEVRRESHSNHEWSGSLGALGAIGPVVVSPRLVRVYAPETHTALGLSVGMHF